MAFKFNTAKARILVIVNQIPYPNRYSRFLAHKLGYTYDYVNKALQDMVFSGIVRREKHGQKAFIVIKQPLMVAKAKEYLLEASKPKK